MRTVPFQRPWSLNVWCGIVGNYIIGPHFFEESLNGEIYIDFLENIFPKLLEYVPLDLRINM